MVKLEWGLAKFVPWKGFDEMNFVDKYLERAKKVRSVLCVGLDPTPEHVPPQFAEIEGLTAYLFKVIRLAAEKAAIIKPQYAYYAALGCVDLLPKITGYAHNLGLQVILDAKRADIGETMEQYGNEVFGQYGVDACTFVPYLGPTFQQSKSSPSWIPWLNKGKCVISMIRTSNPEAAAIQDLVLYPDNIQVFEYMARLVTTWNQEIREETSDAGCVGGVVGATWPEQAARCRDVAGDEVFFLIPGYGAQGGGAEGAVMGLPDSRGRLMGTVNSSRGITRDSWRDKATGEQKPGDPLELVAAAMDAANQDLNSALEAKLGRDPYTTEKEAVQ